MTDRYNDIIALPHHVSTAHSHMSMHDRAAQFMPFRALTGYEDAVQDTAKSTAEKANMVETEEFPDI